MPPESSNLITVVSGPLHVLYIFIYVWHIKDSFLPAHSWKSSKPTIWNDAQKSSRVEIKGGRLKED